jgi:hypothetical protein
VLTSLVAVSLAFLVWLYARTRDQEVLENVPLPVEISLPPGQADYYDLELTGPPQVPVSFRGAPSRIRELRGLLQRGALTVAVTLTIPEDRQNEGHYLDTVRVDVADIPSPPGVTPLIIEGRNRVPVTLHRLVECRLPVRLDPAPDEGVSQVTIEPATVLVRGPEEIVSRARSIPTQPYAVPASKTPLAGDETAPQSLFLVHELEGRSVRTTPSTVRVRFTLRPQQKVYELTDVPVQFLCPANFALRARFVDERAARILLRVTGPAQDEAPAVLAFIDLSGRKFEPGLYADEPVRLQLPKDFQLAQTPPRSAAFQLRAPSEPVKQEGPAPASPQENLVDDPDAPCTH